TLSHTHTYTHILSHTHTYTHTLSHTLKINIDSLMCTHIHTHTHTHTHTHKHPACDEAPTQTSESVRTDGQNRKCSHKQIQSQNTLAVTSPSLPHSDKERGLFGCHQNN